MRRSVEIKVIMMDEFYVEIAAEKAVHNASKTTMVNFKMFNSINTIFNSILHKCALFPYTNESRLRVPVAYVCIYTNVEQKLQAKTIKMFFVSWSMR